MVNKGDWDSLPKLPFNETATRQIFYGENAMIARHILGPGFPSYAHSHPHEQILFIAEGNCIVTVGEEKIEMGPGSMVVVPPNVVHDLEVLGDVPIVNYDIFSPIREDFIEMFKNMDK